MANNYWIIEANHVRRDPFNDLLYVIEDSSGNLSYNRDFTVAKKFATYDDAYNFIYLNSSREPSIARLDNFRTHLIVIK